MRIFLVILSALSILSTSLVAHADLKDRLKIQLGVSTQNSMLPTIMVAYQYVLVEGFLNEAAKTGYFSNMRHVLSQIVGESNVTILEPKSKHAVHDNALILAQELQKIYEK